MPERDANGDYGAGNAMAMRHGSYSLIAKLKAGDAFCGLALDLQEQSRQDLDLHGALEAMREAYSRHCAITLYIYGVLNSRIDPDEAGTLRLVDALRKLNRDTFVMANELRALDVAIHEGAIDYEAILAAKRKQEGKGK